MLREQPNAVRLHERQRKKILDKMRQYAKLRQKLEMAFAKWFFAPGGAEKFASEMSGLSYGFSRLCGCGQSPQIRTIGEETKTR